MNEECPICDYVMEDTGTNYVCPNCGHSTEDYDEYDQYVEGDPL